MRNSRKLQLALLATTALASPALAQDATPSPRQFVDQNGVDLASGVIVPSDDTVSIGSALQGLVFRRQNSMAAHTFSYEVQGTTPSSSVSVIAGQRTIQFDSVGGVYVNKQGTGETLTSSGSSWTFTDRDGTVAQMDLSQANVTADQYKFIGTVLAVANTVLFPNKEKWTLTYSYVTHTDANDITTAYIRPQSAQSSNGYMAKFEYQSNTWNSSRLLTKVTLINTAVDYCSPSTDTCTGLTQTWPSLTFATTGTSPIYKTTTDLLGRATRYSYSSTTNQLIAIRRPTSSSADNTTIGYGLDGRVSSVATDGRTWNYGWTLAGTQLTSTTTNPDTTTRVVVADTTTGQPLSDRNELLQTTSFGYDTNGRLTDVTFPEGNKRHFTYDSRGNVTQAKYISKAPGTPADIIVSASYPSTCPNALTCNRPTSTTDARGNVTLYTYDTTHGGVLTVTSPPATGASTCPLNGSLICPQTRYGYTALQAYYKNSSGSIVASGQPTYLLTSISQCQTQWTCAGAADEVKTTVGYGPQVAGTANNLLPISASKGSGNGALTATTAYTYDSVGNLTYVDGPLSGAADTTRILYDADREVVGQIGPDPDGVGTLPNRAVSLSYNADGQVTQVKRGTTVGQSDSAWAAFSPADLVDTVYDASGRKTSDTLKNGATSYALTQYSYDSMGRLDCVAQRMNTAVYGSLPASACTLSTQGSFGPDRIEQYVYDAASEVTQHKVGVGTTDVATERTLTYSNNGLVATLKDGENNLTTYLRDGFDRVSQIQYPTPTPKGAGTSNASDFEQLSYDPNSNVTSFQIRGTPVTSIGFTYDNLNRVTLKNLPGSEPDVTYAYDNLDRLTSASQTGNALTFGWDALSRKTSEAGPQGTTTFGYDLADEQTSTAYSTNGGGSALTVTYNYLPTGDLSSIQQSGTNLATFSYDAFGNRTNVTFGNGVIQNFTYDLVQRMSQLTNELSGTANDLTATLSYNPASGIASTIRTGDNYPFTAFGNGTTNYTSNGLNQQITIGGATATWDNKGNLTTEPQSGKTYGYSSENLLTSASGGVTLGYDPWLRLYQVVGTGTTRFAYDDLDAIAEYNVSNALQRRFVFDPTTDQPLIWYEGTGVASTNRRYLSQDERGSIISVTDSTGAVLALNKYDEYGKTQTTNSANQGRFGYTGQKWIAEANLYDYKARDYLPHLGIFAQTDPIGYEDSPNLYVYVEDDPINLDDPLGLQEDLGCTPQTNCMIVDGHRVYGAVGGGGGAGTASGSYSNEPGPGGIIIIVGHRRPRAAAPVRVQCRAAPGLEGQYERNLTKVATVLDIAATAAAFTGLEPLALTLEGGSLVLTSLKAYNQWQRRDRTGAYVTGIGFGTSLLAGHISRFVRIGGSGQRHFNAGVASALGNAYGRGFEMLANCE